MIRFVIYPSEGENTHTVSFEDLGTTKDIWGTLTSGQKEMAILKWAKKNSLIEWKLAYYNDEHKPTQQ